MITSGFNCFISVSSHFYILIKIHFATSLSLSTILWLIGSCYLTMTVHRKQWTLAGLISYCRNPGFLLTLASPTSVTSYSNLPCWTQLLSYSKELETERGEREILPCLYVICCCCLASVSRDFLALPEAPISLIDLESCRQSSVTTINAEHRRAAYISLLYSTKGRVPTFKYHFVKLPLQTDMYKALLIFILG